MHVILLGVVVDAKEYLQERIFTFSGDTKYVFCYDQPGQCIKKQRHYFATKGLSSQGYGFSSGHVCM